MVEVRCRSKGFEHILENLHNIAAAGSAIFCLFPPLAHLSGSTNWESADRCPLQIDWTQVSHIATF